MTFVAVGTFRVLNMYAQLSSGAKGLNFDLRFN